MLAAVDDHQLSPCVEKHYVAPRGKQIIVLTNGTDSKTSAAQYSVGQAKLIFLIGIWMLYI